MFRSRRSAAQRQHGCGVRVGKRLKVNVKAVNYSDFKHHVQRINVKQTEGLWVERPIRKTLRRY